MYVYKISKMKWRYATGIDDGVDMINWLHLCCMHVHFAYVCLCVLIERIDIVINWRCNSYEALEFASSPWVWITTSVNPPTTSLVLLMPPSQYVVWQVWDGVCPHATNPLHSYSWGRTLLPHTQGSKGQTSAKPYCIHCADTQVSYWVNFTFLDKDTSISVPCIQDSATLILKCLRAFILKCWTE